jgi:uncharacterized protein YxjI
MTHEAGWYPDPSGRHEHRYWDGTRWTEHVASHGRPGTDPDLRAPPPPTVNRPTEKVVRDVEKVGAAGAGGARGMGGVPPTAAAAAASNRGTVFTEPVLVVNQKAKLIEVNNEYAIYDANGRQIGAVREVGQSKLKKAARVLTSYDQFMTHKLQIVDMAGSVLLAVTRPAKVFKSRVEVVDGAGRTVGQLVQENVFGKIRFALQAGDRAVGSINAENWRAWNFSIRDHTDTEVARITKTWEGLAKTMFTTADNYVVQIHRPLEEPLRSLVVASALSVDTALKQDKRGLG